MAIKLHLKYPSPKHAKEQRSCKVRRLASNTLYQYPASSSKPRNPGHEKHPLAWTSVLWQDPVSKCRAFFSHTQMESAHQLSALGFKLRIGHRTPGNGNLSLSCRDVQDGTPIFHRHLLTSQQPFYFTYASNSLLVSLTSNAPSNLCKSVKLRRLGK